MFVLIKVNLCPETVGYYLDIIITYIRNLGCRTSMVSIQLQRIWIEYTDVILLCIFGD